ncbi:Arc family DNA-binding protein [bacterium]|nr:Arc family DNA-binding protein [bacterium]
MPPRKSFPLRLSPELYEELRRWAEQELRSVNAQMEFILQEAVKRRRGKTEEPDDDES